MTWYHRTITPYNPTNQSKRWGNVVCHICMCTGLIPNTTMPNKSMTLDSSLFTFKALLTIAIHLRLYCFTYILKKKSLLKYISKILRTDCVGNTWAPFDHGDSTMLNNFKSSSMQLNTSKICNAINNR